MIRPSRIVLLLLFAFLTLACSDVIKDFQSLPGGQILSFYDDSRPAKITCSTLIVIGVGTAMRPSDYTSLGTELALATPSIVIFADHSPDSIVKLSSPKFARLANQVHQLGTGRVMGVCNGTILDRFIIGGHSASGKAAWGSFQSLTFAPDGFIGFDPFPFDLKHNHTLPSLSFGFHNPSCGVSVEKAAIALYRASSAYHRVMYVANNTHGNEAWSHLEHCSFADHGCMMICRSSDEAAAFRLEVAKAVGTFVRLLDKTSFKRNDFEPTVDFSLWKLYVNGDGDCYNKVGLSQMLVSKEELAW